MQELITRLTEKTGISVEQANGALETIKEFVKEKFPMLGGAVDNMFASSNPQQASTTAATDSGSMLDKISDFIPGQAGEAAENFAKDKLSGLFGSDK